MKKYTRGIVMFALIAALLVGTIYTAPAAEARASDYLDTYVAGITRSGNTVKVEFTVVGTGTLLSIGSTTIKLYESSDKGSTWSLATTFKSGTTTTMLKANSFFHDSSVVYSGSSSKLYYAIVTFYGANAKGSDSKDYTTTAA